MFIIPFFFQTSFSPWGRIPKWRTGRCSVGPASLAGESILIHAQTSLALNAASVYPVWQPTFAVEEMSPIIWPISDPQPMGWRGRMFFTHFFPFLPWWGSHHPASSPTRPPPHFQFTFANGHWLDFGLALPCLWDSQAADKPDRQRLEDASRFPIGNETTDMYGTSPYHCPSITGRPPDSDYHWSMGGIRWCLRYARARTHCLDLCSLTGFRVMNVTSALGQSNVQTPIFRKANHTSGLLFSPGLG